MDIKLQCALCKIWVNFDKVVFRPDLFENPSNFQNCEICETCDKKIKRVLAHPSGFKRTFNF